MPVTDFQAALARLLVANRTPDSYLAGGAALHFSPHSIRYSNDLDYFHDSVERVAVAFADDERLLRQHGYQIDIEIKQPGYIRALIQKKKEATKLEWSHDSAWRFMPTVQDARCGFRLHAIDLAINKVLALAGRDEARDFLDTLHLHRTLLPLGALCWAAVGKDPGFTPLSLLELLRRRGRYRPEDFARLHLARVIDLPELKKVWIEALASAEQFIHSRPPAEIGCLYYSFQKAQFIAPQTAAGSDEPVEYALHYGRPGGVLPRFLESENLSEE